MTINFMSQIKSMIGSLLAWAAATLLTSLATILLPVLSIFAFVHAVNHPNDTGMVVGAFVVLGPLSCAFWFSAIWKGKNRGGLAGAAGRMFLGLILSVAGLVGLALLDKQLPAVQACVAMYLAVYYPVILISIIKIIAYASGPKCVCNGEGCRRTGCEGTIRRGFCTDCNLDHTVIA